MDTINNAEKELLQAFQSSFIPTDNRSIYDWSSEYVSLASGYSITGKFDCSISPHFKKIFDTYQDPFVREVNILAPPRSGKTLIAELCLLHTLASNSGDILWLQETDDKADQMSDLRMVPLLHSCKPVAELIPTERFSITDNRYKFLHSTVHVSSPKPSTLNSVGYRYVFADECWTYKGDSILKDIKYRTDDYKGVSKCLFFSQGGHKGSAWYAQYTNGEIYEYGWKCPQCNKLQPLTFNAKREDGSRYGITWINNSVTRQENGRWNIRECSKHSVLECKHCKHQVIDSPQSRKALLDGGDYIRMNPEADVNPAIKSFRFTNLCNVKISFSELTTRFLEATRDVDAFGDKANLQSFLMKDMADFWDDVITNKRVEIRLANYNTDKPFGDFLTYRFLTIDCQRTDPFFYYTCRAWNSNGESRLVSYGTCNTWNEIEAVQKRNNVPDHFVFVDTGDGPKTEATRAECLRHGHWGTLAGNDYESWLCYNSLKGAKEPGFKHKDNLFYRYNEPIEYAAAINAPEDEGKTLVHYTFSNFRMSQILTTLRDGKGKTWEAVDVNQEYTDHLNSTYAQQNFKTGKWEYVTKQGQYEHYWDCEKMSVVAADIYGLLTSEAPMGDKPIEMKEA